MAGGIVVMVAARPAAQFAAEVDVLESRRAQGLHEGSRSNCVVYLEYGLERTSATTWTAWSRSSSRKCSMEWFEWPMVRTRAALRLLFGGRHDTMIRHQIPIPEKGKNYDSKIS
jgi:hypothetical protein